MKFRILLNDIPSRDKISLGIMVQIVQKQDQRIGKLTEGKVKRILTSSQVHPMESKLNWKMEKLVEFKNCHEERIFLTKISTPRS
jgi:Uncharacterized conserved protein